VIKDLNGWAPIVHDIVNATPLDRLVDSELVFRDPLPTSVSPKARIALIGSAAHPFLPISIQGASQPMEDGVDLAICLDKSGKHKIQQAVRAYEAIRYERVHKAQMTGFTTRSSGTRRTGTRFEKIHNRCTSKETPGCSILTKKPTHARCLTRPSQSSTRIRVSTSFRLGSRKERPAAYRPSFRPNWWALVNSG
jgi:hypothetical protein